MRSRYVARHRPAPPRHRRVPTRRPGILPAAVLATACAVLLGTGAASAADRPAAPHRSAHAAQVPFEMHEFVDHSTESYTFTSADPLCASGTFVDHVTVVSANPAKGAYVWSVDTTYTCDDASGTFTATKHLRRDVAPNGNAYNVGRVKFTGGTGAYGGLAGRGVDVGASANGQGAGMIVGRVRTH